jgi:hypothetical protein
VLLGNKGNEDWNQPTAALVTCHRIVGASLLVSFPFDLNTSIMYEELKSVIFAYQKAEGNIHEQRMDLLHI